MIISDWEKWQTFRKDRGTPPWIKVYRNLLSNEQWVELTDSEKGQLVSIWILAADKNGTIPDSPKMIQRMAMLDSKPNINKFIELGFLTTTCQPSDNQELKLCPQVDTPEESRVEKSREDIDYSCLAMSDDEVVDLIEIRKKNKGTKLTQRIVGGLAKEFNQVRINGMTNDQILTEWETRGWKSFKAEWVKSNSTNQPDFSDTSTDWVNKDYGLL